MSFASFTRALSPSFSGPSATAATIVVADDDAMDKEYVVSATAGDRHTALQAANSVGEVIGFIPHDFRHVLAPFLRGVASTAERLISVQSTLTKWTSHQAAGTFPPFLSQKGPEVQFTKGFEESDTGRAQRAKLAESHKRFLNETFANLIRAKGDEVTFLKGALDPTTLFNQMHPLVIQRVGELTRASKIPRYDVDKDGNVKVLDWVENTAVAKMGKAVISDCVVYAYRVISIVEVSNAMASRKKEAKKAVHQQADVEMQDGATSGPSIQSLIDKGINAALKRVGSSVSDPVASSSSFTNDNGKRPLLPPVWEGTQSCGSWREQETQPTPQGTNWRQRRKCARFSRDRSWRQGVERKGERDDAYAVYPTPRQESQKPCPKGHKDWRSQGKGSDVTPRSMTAEDASFDSILVSHPMPGSKAITDLSTSIATSCIKSTNFVYGDPSSIPDEVLSLTLPQAVKWVVMNTPLMFIEAARFKSHIHTGPGVSIPTHIEHSLSVGMKYLFHQPRRTELISDAWTDFERRLRWRVYFMLKGDHTTYDPDYDVRAPSKKDPPLVPFYFHLALVKGRSYVFNSIAKIPEETEQDGVFKPLGPKLNEVKKFLLDHDYVVTATDKNLGIAVSERTWILSKSLDCISDEQAYRPLTADEAKIVLDRKCATMRDLAQRAELFDWKFGSLSEFLAHKITANGEEHHVPKFYGIPKIHKQPVKFRPILPCHSAIQNPAAKFCSKVLKPIVNAAPTIIRGTKDLAIKLSTIKIPPWREIYLVTGDVVAYYPNIPLQKCLDRVLELYMEHYWNVADHDESMNRKEQDLFYRCLIAGNTELLTQFQGKTYQQLLGLAMGVADSPDLANLYGWYCERREKVLEHPDIVFYGRYIDDCFAVVCANSEEEAKRIVASVVKIDDCELTWEAGKFLPFLDMMLYVDEYNQLQHRPYMKARNHQERIPWISAHPYDVKRGTFYGEMSRLATLSSLKEHYLEALDGLVALYVMRGYPIGIVKTWRKAKQQERWSNRLRIESRDKPEVLVLKSHFNTAWNYFNARELGDTIMGYVRGWLNAADRMEFSREFPPWPRQYPDVLETSGGVVFETVNDAGLRIIVPDMRKIDIPDRQVIVSRKRTFNLYDTVNLWKRIVLEQLDERESSADAIRPLDEPHPLLAGNIAGYRRLRSGRLIADNDDEDPQRRSPSPGLFDNVDDDTQLATLLRIGLR